MLAGTFAHFFQTKIDKLELQIVRINSLRFQFEHAHYFELKAHTTTVTQRTSALIEMRFDIGHRPDMVIGGSLYEDSHAMRTITLIKDLLIILHFLTLRAFDSGFNPVLGHVHAFGVLKTTPEGRIGGRIGSAGFYGNGNFLSDTGKLFGHPVPPGKHRVLSYFKYATHNTL